MLRRGCRRGSSYRRTLAVERFVGCGLGGKLVGRVIRGLDAEAKTALVAIDLDNARRDLLAGFEHVLDLLDAFLADLRDMHETVDAVLQLHEGAMT